MITNFTLNNNKIIIDHINQLATNNGVVEVVETKASIKKIIGERVRY